MRRPIRAPQRSSPLFICAARPSRHNQKKGAAASIINAAATAAAR